MPTETMSPRERVCRAIRHEVPDRVPIDLGGFQTGIHRAAYVDLLAHLGLRDEVRILDPVQQVVAPCEAVLQRLHVDTRYLVAHGPQGFEAQIVRTHRGGKTWQDLRDEWGVVWSMPEDQGLYMDITHHPLAHATLRDLERYPFPDGADPSRFTGLRAQAEALRQTPYAICTGIGGVVYEICWYMRGLERWFMDMVEQPAFCEALLEHTLDYWLGFYTGFLGAVGDLVDVVMIGDDLAGQGGPLFSPRFYRQIVKPRQKRLVQHIKGLTEAKVWYHTCGAVTEYIPDLLDNGVDILNPVQVSARGMAPERLKREFGERIVFWGGGIDAQHVLPTATPEVVREQTCQSVRAFMGGGGYVFNNVHNIQAGVPPANVVALFDAAYDCGWYGR